MQTQLYIENTLVDLTSAVSFPVTKQFEDMQDPTAILNEFSKTVSLPFSNTNDRLFGLIFNPTRAVVTDGQEHDNKGIWFDPTKKMSAKLVFNGNVLLQGYAKMTGIKRTPKGGVYEINLFGELGTFFADVKGITWADMTSDLAGNSFTIDRNIVNTSWTTEPDLDTESVEDADTTDIIGFACCNQGIPEGFDAESVQVFANTETSSFAQIKDALAEQLGDTYNVDGLIGDGLTERQMGQFRSYYQQPYIYMPRFFEIVKRSIEANTDYTLTLHEDWFFNKNPYYRNLVMMLSRLHNEDSQTEVRLQDTWSATAQVSAEGSPGWREGTIKSVSTTIAARGMSTIRCTMPITLAAKKLKEGGITYTPDNIGTNQALCIYMTITGLNGNVLTLKKYLCKQDQGDMDGDVIILPDDEVCIDNGGYSTTLIFETVVSQGTMGESVSIQIGYTWWDTEHDYNVYHTTIGLNKDIESHLTITDAVLYNVVTLGEWRSGFSVTLADLWDTDKTPWDVLVEYCKTYGLLIDYDILTKTCTIMPRGTYFKAGGIEDWTKRLDTSKDFIIHPSSFTDKYITFDPTDNTDKGKGYEEQVGVGFGGVKINTGYDFNTSSKEIYGGKAPIFSSENILPFTRMLAANFTYINAEPMPYAADEGEPADMFGTMYFYNGLAEFNSNIGIPYITDDSTQQVVQKKMSYLYGIGFDEYATQVTTYPKLDVRYEKSRNRYIPGTGWVTMKIWSNQLCTYGIPAYNYDSTKSYTTDDKGIYGNFWEEYINERYGVNTKVIDCYLWITPAVFAAFKLNTFILIDNRLYLLNKICDYDCTKMQPTKCQLVSVYNYYAYTDNAIEILYEFVEDVTQSNVLQDYWNGGTAVLTKGAWNNNIANLPNQE